MATLLEQLPDRLAHRRRKDDRWRCRARDAVGEQRRRDAVEVAAVSESTLTVSAYHCPGTTCAAPDAPVALNLCEVSGVMINGATHSNEGLVGSIYTFAAPFVPRIRSHVDPLKIRP